MTAPESLREITNSRVDVADDPFDAAFVFDTVDDQVAVLRLDQPVLAGMIADLARVDQARAAASGYPVHSDNPPAGTLADSVAHTDAPVFDDAGLRPVQAAQLVWNESDPWHASLQFSVDQAAWSLDLGVGALTALLADLRQLNRERAVQAGWADPDDVDTDDGEASDDDHSERLRRLLPGRAPVMSLMDQLPQRWQLIVALAVLVLVIVLVILFNVVL